ncbi:MAG: Alpha/beta hydrolase [Mycobacterium sp.]|nr:Alpha/beta hydrolase [Mycobacterium sp.]
MYLECSGTGSPTVVLVSGAGVASDNWSYAGHPEDAANPPERTEAAVYPQTARLTRVCAYDRPGTQRMDDAASRSTAVSQPTTAQGDVADLHALLTIAGVAGPYVLVGNSWGGFIATTYPRMYPDDVSGLVLVDPGSRFLQTALPPAAWEKWMRDIATNARKVAGRETPDYPSSIAALDTMPPMPAMPVTVLSADKPFDYLGTGDANTYWPQRLNAAARLSTDLDAKHITQTNSDHFIENENPGLVVKQICSVLSPARDC